MSTDTQELIQTYEQLPQDKQTEVADFARFLLAQQGDMLWERIIAEPAARPKLETFLKASKAEGAAPLDLEQL